MKYLSELKGRAKALSPIKGDTPMTMPLTGLIVTILVICLGIYDLIMVVWKGTGSSVSDFLIRAGFTSGFVKYAFGFVSGHLFGRMYLVGHPDAEHWWFVISAALFGGFVGFGIANLLIKKRAA